ncbi:hypothetical protein [Burkholderia cenocepacia]|uniref:hypothetical protein n=1 Tax=Burkholderia cenocepacia TaxID=95486 RepID=UPI001BADA47F|nr:hypothetical protein [Burkholderia cenocepacia]QUN56106.1 hypothetical protein KEH58_08245 [Burkholderia cenocepacia]
MSEIKDGGPAFPWGEHGTHLGGMTLRDYFAAKALTGMLAEPLSDDTEPSSIFFTPNFDKEYAQPGDRIAAAAYVLADAMLRARGEA